MVKDDTVYSTFKKNVPYYNVGLRRFRGDNDGVLLTNEYPTYRVAEEDLREFKMVNRRVLTEGLVVEVEEEGIDWEINNALTDAQARDLLKNYAKLKSTLATLTSPVIVQKLLTFAVEEDKPRKTVSLIQARLDEISPDEPDVIYREDIRQSYDE